MKITNKLKGYLLALVSVIAVSNVYIFSKAALLEVSLPQFGTYWFLFGLIWVVLFAWYRKSFKLIKELSPKNYLVLLFLGVVDVIGTFFFFKAIYTISNPTIVSFIGNISPALVITLSFIILKERFNKLELLGMIMAISGAFIISYKGNSGIDDMFIDGAQYVLISSTLGAFNSVVIKKNIINIPPIIFTLSRTIFLLFFSIIALILTKDSLIIPISAIKNIVIGSILGPFLTVIAGYLALQYILLSRKAIFASTKGLFVLFGSYLYFGNFPDTVAIIGGGVTIIGVLMIAFGKIQLQREIKSSSTIK